VRQIYSWSYSVAGTDQHPYANSSEMNESDEIRIDTKQKRTTTLRKITLNSATVPTLSFAHIRESTHSILNRLSKDQTSSSPRPRRCVLPSSHREMSCSILREILATLDSWRPSVYLPLQVTSPELDRAIFQVLSRLKRPVSLILICRLVMWPEPRPSPRSLPSEQQYDRR